LPITATNAITARGDDTTGSAGICVYLITIITDFIGLDDTITTQRQGAVVTAIIDVDPVAVVTLFGFHVMVTVATTRRAAIVQTSINLDNITIITGLKTRFALGDILSVITVAAGSFLALIGTGI
jgi:hypothetical protein